MARRDQGELLAELARVQEQFTAWRQTRKPKSRIPETLWELAVEQAVAQGLHRTARALKLDYYALKKRVLKAQGNEEGGREEKSPAFLELPPVLAPAKECLIELQQGTHHLRVHLKGFGAVEVGTIAHCLRSEN